MTESQPLAAVVLRMKSPLAASTVTTSMAVGLDEVTVTPVVVETLMVMRLSLS